VRPAFLPLLLLTACSPSWTTCVVVGERFDPAHVRVYYEEICLMRARNFSCSLSIPDRREEHLPDRWYLTYQRSDTGAQHEEQVSRALYENHPTAATHDHRDLF